MSYPISARKDGSNTVYSKGPDVCLTPPQPVPVAYSSIAFFGAAQRTSRTVRNNGKKDFQLNSRPATVVGHEPGVKKGVKVAGYKSHAVVKKGGKTVFSEGYAVVRDGDPAEINRPGPGGSPAKRSRSKVKHDLETM